MSKVYVREGNELVEKSTIKAPRPYYEHNNEYDTNYSVLMNRYKQHIASLHYIPIHPLHLKDFEFGKEYGEDDFDKHWQVMASDGKGRWLAIPKPKETNGQDELWMEVGRLIIEGYDYTTEEEMVAKLKQLYTIHKK